VTDSIEEYLCVMTDDFIEARSCDHSTVAPTSDQISSMSETTDVVQKTIVEFTVGCNICDKNSIPTLAYDSSLGLYYQ